MKRSVVVIENDQFDVQFVRLIRSISVILMSGNVRIIESGIDHICRTRHFCLIAISSY